MPHGGIEYIYSVTSCYLKFQFAHKITYQIRIPHKFRTIDPQTISANWRHATRVFLQIPTAISEEKADILTKPRAYNINNMQKLLARPFRVRFHSSAGTE